MACGIAARLQWLKAEAKPRQGRSESQRMARDTRRRRRGCREATRYEGASPHIGCLPGTRVPVACSCRLTPAGHPRRRWPAGLVVLGCRLGQAERRPNAVEGAPG